MLINKNYLLVDFEKILVKLKRIKNFIYKIQSTDIILKNGLFIF